MPCCLLVLFTPSNDHGCIFIAQTGLHASKEFPVIAPLKSSYNKEIDFMQPVWLIKTSATVEVASVVFSMLAEG
jgi:hypothetical protein